jgi:hypothetical protein
VGDARFDFGTWFGGGLLGAAYLGVVAAAWAARVEGAVGSGVRLAIAAAVLAAAGLAVAWRRGRAPSAPARWMSGVLAVTAFFALAFAALFHWMAGSVLAEGDEAARFLAFGRDALVPLGALLGATILARARRHRVAAPLMLASGIARAPIVPPGTAVLFAWTFWLRAKEA